MQRKLDDLAAQYEILREFMRITLGFLNVGPWPRKNSGLRTRNLETLEALKHLDRPKDPDVQDMIEGMRLYIEGSRIAWDTPEHD